MTAILALLPQPLECLSRVGSAALAAGAGGAVQQRVQGLAFRRGLATRAGALPALSFLLFVGGCHVPSP